MRITRVILRSKFYRSALDTFYHREQVRKKCSRLKRGLKFSLRVRITTCVLSLE